MIKAVIFDLDGTLADTLPLCITSFRQAIEPLSGVALSDADIIATFGPSEEGTIRQLVPDHYREGVEGYLHHYRRLHGMCPAPFEGIRETILKLRSSGFIVALVTGKGKRSCDITLDLFGMAGLFDRIETGSPEGQRKKEGILAVLDSFGLKPAEAFYVGDAPGDIEVCHRIDVPVIAAAWAGTADPHLLIPLKPYRIFYTVPEFDLFLNEEVLKRD